jgi:hypothetical protein
MDYPAGAAAEPAGGYTAHSSGEVCLSNLIPEQPPTADEMEAMLQGLAEKTRPPWYERAPYSWIIGFVGGILSAGIIHYLGWG